ncbi:hypothetical protein AVEN_231914-1 [Araneus ventricosus]|uniref:Uncharacterized protein n=1 Tax=Araneus ventricosus TaxID=182803 RepID=A0A4Y2S8I0_ARAVE|nr:hypothetical protein AVEN_231914-1 [Araneus ventricosus]
MSDTNSLRKLYDRAETEIRNLESLGINSDSYGNLLTPIILKVLPSDLTLEFSRQNKSDSWDLGALKFLGEEIQSREAAFSFHSSARDKQNAFHSNQECNNFASSSRSHFRNTYGNPKKGYKSSATELLVNYSTANNKCIFCGSENSHDSSSCDLLKREKGCSFCGSKSHPKTLCYRFYQNNSNKTNVSDQASAIARREESEDPVASASSCQTETKSQRVLLQTASAIARYEMQSRNCRLLADTAAQRRVLLKKELSRLLRLPIIRKEKLSVYSFGDKSPVEKTFNVVKIRLQSKDDPNSYLEIETLETEKISAAHIPPPNIDISIYNKHLKGLKLADTINNDTDVSVLIGADNYYDVMTGRIKRINRKLVAAESLYGWCLIGVSGPPNKN